MAVGRGGAALAQDAGFAAIALQQVATDVVSSGDMETWRRTKGVEQPA